jgi:hypothetical protein
MERHYHATYKRTDHETARFTSPPLDDPSQASTVWAQLVAAWERDTGERITGELISVHACEGDCE